MGAVQLKTSTYLLPDEPAQYEQFQWLAQQIRDYGGDSTLVRAQEIEGLTSEKAVAMFNEARARDYVELRRSLQSFIGRRKKLDVRNAHKTHCDFRQVAREDWRDDSRRRPRRCEISARRGGRYRSSAQRLGEEGLAR